METNNMTIWSALAKTDPKHTKPFKRNGGFKGTAVKPIYCTQRMTEQFGPCGHGWGVNAPEFQVVNGTNQEILVYCTVSIWWANGREKNTIYGVGGDKVVTHIKANPEYNRPERWEADDEAFKKAFTDAIGNAMKQLGMSADIHMGLFDDNKYVNDLRQEFSEEGKSLKQQHQRKDPPPSQNATSTPFDDASRADLCVPVPLDAEASGSDWKLWATTLLPDRLRVCRNADEVDSVVKANLDALNTLKGVSPQAHKALMNSATKRAEFFIEKEAA